jgi:hypothetical protein
MQHETFTSPEQRIDDYMELSTHPEQLDRLFADFYELFRYAPGSRGAHHFWYGGWMDHNQDMLDHYTDSYKWCQAQGWLDRLPDTEQFSYQDGITVILAHDLEKPFRYADYVENISADISNDAFHSIPGDKTERKNFRGNLLNQYGIDLSPVQQNALRFVEGVRDEDYRPGERVDKPLAALCHLADLASARIGYDMRGPYYAGEIYVEP